MDSISESAAALLQRDIPIIVEAAINLEFHSQTEQVKVSSISCQRVSNTFSPLLRRIEKRKVLTYLVGSWIVGESNLMLHEVLSSFSMLTCRRLSLGGTSVYRRVMISSKEFLTKIWKWYTYSADAR